VFDNAKYSSFYFVTPCPTSRSCLVVIVSISCRLYWLAVAPAVSLDILFIIILRRNHISAVCRRASIVLMMVLAVYSFLFMVTCTSTITRSSLKITTDRLSPQSKWVSILIACLFVFPWIVLREVFMSRSWNPVRYGQHCYGKNR